MFQICLASSLWINTTQTFKNPFARRRLRHRRDDIPNEKSSDHRDVLKRLLCRFRRISILFVLNSYNIATIRKTVFSVENGRKFIFKILFPIKIHRTRSFIISPALLFGCSCQKTFPPTYNLRR